VRRYLEEVPVDSADDPLRGLIGLVDDPRVPMDPAETRSLPLRRAEASAVKVGYVETGAFIAVTNKRDQVRDAAVEQFLCLTTERAILVTSNFVVAETATRLRYDAGLHVALAFRNILDAAARNGALTVRYADAELGAAAWDVMARFDPLALSLADCVGAATAGAAQATQVFGFDSDFRVMGCTLVPVC
jgi:hypothetical protein